MAGRNTLAQKQSNPTHGGSISMLGVCIHTPVARTFFCCTVCLRTSAHFSCVCTYTHGSRLPKRFFAHVSHLTFSSLMSHPSLLFLDGHVQTIPDSDIHTFLPYLPVLKAHGMRLSARGREVWHSGQVRPQHKVGWRCASCQSMMRDSKVNKMTREKLGTTMGTFGMKIRFRTRYRNWIHSKLTGGHNIWSTNLQDSKVCNMLSGHSIESVGQAVGSDKRCRRTTFGVDTAACRNVVQARHPATREYRCHWDAEAGVPHSTAGKCGTRVDVCLCPKIQKVNQ